MAHSVLMRRLAEFDSRRVDLKKELLVTILNFIAKATGISKGTASRWLKDHPLSEDQRRALLGRTTGGHNSGGEAKKIAARKVRQKYQMLGREQARKLDPEHLKSCMLYWAEGRKSKNQIGFCNTDADMLLAFRNFLTKFYNVEDSEYRLWVNCYLAEDISKSDVETYWSDLLRLPKDTFSGGLYKKVLESSFRTNRHRFGICSLYVNRTDVVQQIFGAIQEYMGIDRPEWLDRA